MSKLIVYDQDARAKLQEGVNKLARAVVATLGPRSNNVAIQIPYGAPQVIHDGVSVAKEIYLKDPFEDMGAQLVKEAAQKTNDAAGDGTTTATLFSQEMVNEGIKLLSSGTNAMMLRSGIDKAVAAVVEEINKLSLEVSPEDCEKVATISAQNKEIGAIIAQAIEMVGPNGLIEVEDGSGISIELDHQEGMDFRKGWMSFHFVTDGQHMEANLENVSVLLSGEKINEISKIAGFLNEAIKANKSVLIIADDYSPEVLAVLATNKMQGKISVCPVQSPYYGDTRKEVLEDLAVLTGGTIFDSEVGKDLSEATLDTAGSAKSVIVSKNSTRIIGGSGKKEFITARISEIETQLENADSLYDQEILQERLAKLTSGVAVIKVGAPTEVQLRELKERVRDAKEATKSALENGVVAGGGTTFLKSRKVLKEISSKDKDEQAGIDLVYQVLEAPLRKLADNCGKDGGFVVNKVDSSRKENYGLNAYDLKFCDLLEAGIIDPAKVEIEAIINASGVAGSILTTSVLVVEEPEEENGARK